jgi:RNA polymerase sigma-70 factor, ECF subfamily
VIAVQKSADKLQPRKTPRLPVEMSSTELNELFADCMPKLQKSARRMFRNKEDSEDALQDALLLAFRKIDQFEGRSAFSTWLHTIVRNTSKGYFRKAAAHPTVSADAATELDEGLLENRPLIDERPTPEQNCIQHERFKILRHAAAELPEKYQAAVCLFYLRGLGEKDTAKALGITLSALKAHLHRSRVLMSYRIRKRCMMDARQDLSRLRPLMRLRRAPDGVASVARRFHSSRTARSS